MNSLKDADFYATFPPALKKDEKMVALGRLIADELHQTVEQTKKNIIYANINELSETWLDVLAYDLHVDWYDYDYPIEAKRAIIRDSVRVHQKLGTKAAVEMALGGIHPKSEIEEWFDYANTWLYGNDVYGVPSTATTQGIVYNKKVFEDAGVTDVPKTPDEFIDALKKIKDKTDAIPLYTNYAAGWTMGAWDAYIGNNATGDNTYFNQKLLHTKDPFKDYGDGTHPYAVYKILYDAVAGGLTEDDYSTTDWEGSKSMLNNGQIGCMVLGSWAYPQMEAAGENADDIGYMPFPISVNGEQYASAGADYSYGINVNASDDEKQAALIFVKWMTEKSGFSYNEDGLPVAKSSSDTKLDFSGVTFLEDEPAVEGEEDLLNALNADSELNINNGGNDKIQAIIEHAANGDESFDDIMNEWNQKWTDYILKKGDDLKNRISALRKQQMNRMQEGDNASLKASMVYLNILQESQELVSIWRHLLRASRFFQGDYVPQEVSMIALTEER